MQGFKEHRAHATPCRCGRQPLLLCLVTIVALAMVGCAPKKGVVSGVVTYKGKPVPNAAVTFHGPNGTTGGGVSGPDGKYTVNEAPVGSVKIAVATTPPITLPGPAGAAKPPSGLPGGLEDPMQGMKYVPLPAKYADTEQSGLTLTVTGGKQDYNIDLQ
jgi:hypothetical protein